MESPKIHIGRDSRAEISVPKTATRIAQFSLGDVVRHRMFDFRGVVFDVDPEFSNSEEWYDSIPEEVRPARNQPFYHLFAENDDSSYVAYVSQQNLVSDADGGPVSHPGIDAMFEAFNGDRYQVRRERRH
jgi:heat shock protein HspQ